MSYVLKIDLTVGGEEHLAMILDATQDVKVTVEGERQAGLEVATFAIEGDGKAILAWLEDEWQDDEAAMDEFVKAAREGRLVEKQG